MPDDHPPRQRRPASAHPPSPQASRLIGELLGEEPRRRDLLIEYLHQLQERVGHLAEDHLRALARELRLAPAEVFEVATFYHHFSVVREGEPAPPPLTVRVCDSLGCALAGAEALIGELEKSLPEGARLQRVPCVGRCQQAPVAVVGTNPIAEATAEQARFAVENRETEPEIPDYIDFKRYSETGGYRCWQRCLDGELDAERVIGELEQADLRGLGGAGFPAARKWRLVREHPSPRLLVVNIDEGEPGTFKDRHFLESDPHRFLEGALIAAWAVEAEAVYLYLRDEYATARHILTTELEALRETFDDELPAIHLRRGAGAYICGEESALIESIEGKRGLPRQRPPYIAQEGLFGRPTLEHNLETLHWVRDILEGNQAALRDASGRTLRTYSVSGRVAHPGVYRAPAGISVRELIDDHAGGMLPGHELYAYLPGGASGGILPASLAHLPLDFGTLEEYGCFIGSAAVVVLSQQDRAVDAALNAMRFFAHESCGQCTPCRVGTAKAVQLMAAERWDVPLLEELARAMRDASICGLGQAAPNPLECVLRYFPHEIPGGGE
ncbi:MAG: NADH-ubiquinone oxidoreductase-F iron-sulfur binding region domain-containing protein [Gammaproteobacteria bacterium]